MPKDSTVKDLDTLHKQAKSARSRLELVRMREDAWLAGFTDGEGCFYICGNTGGFIVPRFKISLRADDVNVLEELCTAFGGFVSMCAAQEGQRPAVQWVVSGKKDLPKLVAYFDRFPLRAKKAQDYSLWRRAVSAYCAQGGKAPELPLLRVALMDGRVYSETEHVPIDGVPERQLRLVAEGG
jgi:hypothetical protein